MSSTTSGEGFAKYQAFYEREPSLVVHWHDDKTPAKGWLCIDSLTGGAAGGGTRMHARGTREEAVFLAKTMGVKFRACGPAIGGAKSVIQFDPTDAKAKQGVLERWFAHIGPYLRSCYGTGGDVNVGEVEATRIAEKIVGVGHVQEGIARGHHWKDDEKPKQKIARLRKGTEAKVKIDGLPVPKGQEHWTIADAVTGLGVATSIIAYEQSRGRDVQGQRVAIEGFGAVGAFAAHYLAQHGAVLVACSSRLAAAQSARPYRIARCGASAGGLDVSSLIAAREGTNLAGTLPSASLVRGAEMIASDTGDELFEVACDIFVAAAASHTLDARRIKQLRGMGVRLVSCGANNPFAYDRSHTKLTDWVSDMLALQREADKAMAIIPDFVANCGMARTFHYLMAEGASLKPKDILSDAEQLISKRVKQLVKGHDAETGLLDRGFAVFFEHLEHARAGWQYKQGSAACGAWR
jgi:glutamate dehydrogenase (NAD(P)+)